ncbi:MAG TPA: CAP domain-containing protein, partial [Mycobacteriales bacterium]|nr:CAP domain-containing protein [Mycobacteriales bacterium]
MTAARRLPARLLLGALILALVEAGVVGTSQVEPVRAAAPAWLDRFNAWRANGGVPILTEDATFDAGDVAHAEYMVKNDLIAHYETAGTPYYTAAGDTAARNSNIYVSSSTSTADTDAIDWWMQAPFHSMGMMDPRLRTTGFGSYRETKSGWDMGAAVNVVQGNSFTGGAFPVYFPGSGTTEPLTSYGGG